MRKQPMGRLVIQTPGSARAQLFINERFAGIGSTVSIELFAGTYRVFAQTASGPSRIHPVKLSPGAQVTVTIDTTFDKALRTHPQPILILPPQSARTKLENRYAVALARLGKLEDGAIVLSVHEQGSKRRLVGRVLSATGKRLREGSILLTSDVPARRLHALAAFLDGDPPSPDIRVHALDGVRPAHAPKPRRDSFRFGKTKWLALSAGVIAAGVGVWALSMHNRGTCTLTPPELECERLYDTRTGGVVSLSFAAVALGVTVYAWRHDRKRSTRRLSIAPAAGGFSVAFERRF